MSNVVSVAGAGSRGKARAVVLSFLACIAVGGCSADVDRFSSASFGSGYEEQASLSPSYGPSHGLGLAAADSGRISPRVPSQDKALRLARADPGDAKGYLQVARVDLPPLPPQQQAASAADRRTKLADGYGIYNRGPVADGVYTGPRVFTPYDRPREDIPPPPPPYYAPKGDDPARYEHERDSDADGVPPPYFRKSSGVPRVYEPKPEPETPVYEPRPYEPRPRAEGRFYEPGPRQEYGRAADLPPRDFGDRPGYRPRPFYPAEEYGPRRFLRGEARPAFDNTKIARSSDPVAADRGNGKVVTVQPGETLYTLAIRYGVTVDMIAQANGLSGRAVRPGQDLLIPRAGPVSFSHVESSKAPAEAVACVEPRCHLVRKGETIASLAREYRLPARRIMEANNLTSVHSLKPGQRLEIPLEIAPARQGAEAPAGNDGTRKDTASLPPAAIPSEAVSQVKPEPEVKTAMVTPGAEPSCDAALANPMPRTGKTFRKPVEGLIISKFGAQRDGTINEGVTISVPKGTPIKAAENGVVAYVGDELPGFGNLILIRHADEYVTAYAHADEILVKKCDVVKRGQIVGKAGATGDASQPQLHFEIRKNSKPVDPQPLLSS